MQNTGPKTVRSRSLGLPPPDVRKFDLETDDKIDTLLDERGLVDIKQVIELAKAMPREFWLADYQTEIRDSSDMMRITNSLGKYAIILEPTRPIRQS